eukprot:jgi/Picre1/27380/NNA_000347.t1
MAGYRSTSHGQYMMLVRKFYAASLECLISHTGSNKKTKSKNREYLYLASSDVEQALKHAKKKTNVNKTVGKKSKKKAGKKEDEIPVRIVQEAPEEKEEQEEQVEKDNS